MTGLEYALEHVHHGENEIHEQLLRIAERHHAEHEVHYVARDPANWSHEHVERIADAAKRFGVKLSTEADEPTGIVERMRAVFSNVTARKPESGVLLLEDLRALYLRASDNSLAWEMLAQVAQSEHKQDLLELSEECHPQTLRQIRWANTMLKTQTPQILASLK